MDPLSSSTSVSTNPAEARPRDIAEVLLTFIFCPFGACSLAALEDDDDEHWLGAPATGRKVLAFSFHSFLASSDNAYTT